MNVKDYLRETERFLFPNSKIINFWMSSNYKIANWLQIVYYRLLKLIT